MSKAKNDGVTYEVRAGQALKTMVGWVGDDWLQGGSGNDVLIDLLGDNLFDAGAGSDTVIGGFGDDIFVHRIGQNAGARDHYEGALGTDTLRLVLTAAEWARGDIQADIQRFLAHVGTLKNKITGLVGLTGDFTFKSTNLTVSNIEKLDVRVDGVSMNLADEAVVARNDRLQLHEDAGPTTIDLLANDSAPDRVASIQLLTASQLGTATLAPTLLTSTQTAVLTFVPGAAAQALRAGETRTETLTYRTTDVDGDTSTATVTIVVEGRNDAAMIGDPSAAALQEDVGVSGGQLKTSGRIAISDADTGEASFRTAVTALPGALGALSLAADGTYTFSVGNAAVQHLGAGETHVSSFRITALDGTGKVVSFTIRGSNDGPEARADIAGPLVERGTASGTSTASGNVLANDTDVDLRDTKAVSAVNGDDAKVGAHVAGLYGHLVLGADGDWIYRLDDGNPATDRLAQGQTVQDAFTYTMRDGQGAVSTTTLTLTVRGGNDAPTVSEAVSAAVTEGAAPVEIDLLQGAADVDAGAVLRVANLVGVGPDGPGLPAGLTWSGAMLRVDPRDAAFDALAAGETRVLTVAYDVIDEHDARVAQVATITVTGTNDAPTVSASGRSVAENAAGAVVATLVVGDVDTASGLTFRVLDGTAEDARFVVVAAAGTVSGAPGDYEVRLAPGRSFDFEALEGRPTLLRTVEVHDGQADDAVAAVAFTVTVTDVPEAPTATDDRAATLEDRAVTFTVAQLTGNDQDPGGAGPLTITGVAGALNGTVSFADGIVTFRPLADFSGVASFTYTLSNGAGIDAGRVVVDVRPVADAPALITGAVTGESVKPLGGDVVVNSTRTDNQQNGSVASIDGGYVITWSSLEQDGSHYGVYSQRYDLNGIRQGSETRVNSTVLGIHDSPSVNAIEGGYVVTWSSLNQDGNGWGVYAQRFDATGRAVGDEARINTYTPSDQFFPSASAIPGGYIVTWSSLGQDGSGWGVYAQRFDLDGIPRGIESRVNTHVADDQLYSSVTAIGSGYVVTWSSEGQDGDRSGIYAQRFDSSGVAQGAEMRVNTHIQGLETFPSVAAIDTGFVVTWSSYGQDGSGWGIYSQRFDANGVPAGDEALVSTFGFYDQVYSSVVAVSGGYVVTWTSEGQDGNGWGIYARRFGADGAPRGPEFRVNADVDGTQFTYGYLNGQRSVAATPDGQLIVVWDQDVGTGDVEHRRFKLPAVWQGDEDTVIAIPVSAVLADLDGSESLSRLELLGVPAGATISDGTNLAVSTGAAISILGWEAASLTFMGPPNAHGAVSLVLSADVTDTATVSSGPETATATYTRAFDIVVRSVNDAATVGGVAAGGVSEDSPDASGNLVATGMLTISDVDAGEASFVPRANIAGLYGTFGLSADGNWAYTARNDQSAIQALGAGEAAVDSFTAVSQDGSASQLVTVTIQGTNDRPVAVADIGSAGENERKLFDVLANDSDADRLDIKVLTSLGAITVGGASPTTAQAASFTIVGDQLLFDPDKAFEFLPEGQVAEVVVRCGMADAAGDVSESHLTLRVDGRNDQPVFGGQTSGTVTEDGQISTSGQLTVQDPDSGQSRFVSPSVTGRYGSLTIDPLGEWSYLLNNGLAAVQGLNTGQSLTDILTVRTADGTTTDIRIRIDGTTDPAYVDLDGQPITYGWEYRASGPPAARSYVQTDTVGPQVEFTHRDIWNQSWTVDLNDTVVTIDYLTSAYWSPGAFNGMYLTDTQGRLPDFTGIETVSNNTGAVVSVVSPNEIAVNWQNTAMTPSSLISFRIKTTAPASDSLAVDLSTFALEDDGPLAARSEPPVPLPLPSPADLAGNDYLLV